MSLCTFIIKFDIDVLCTSWVLTQETELVFHFKVEERTGLGKTSEGFPELKMDSRSFPSWEKKSFPVKSFFQTIIVFCNIKVKLLFWSVLTEFPTTSLLALKEILLSIFKNAKKIVDFLLHFPLVNMGTFI